MLLLLFLKQKMNYNIESDLETTIVRWTWAGAPSTLYI